MSHVLRSLLFVLAGLLPSQFAAAQFFGTYEVQTMEGGPVVEGGTAYCKVYVDEGGRVRSQDTVDYHDGNGPQVIEGEESTFTQVDHTGLNWLWVNARGTVGLISYNSRTGNFECTILTGPNEGRQTQLVRV